MNKTVCLFISCLLLVAACKDFKTTDDGVRYKRIASGDNPDLKPVLGDIMTLHVVFRNGNTIIKQFINTDIQLSKSKSKGDLWSGFTMMAKGDSITFAITAKQLYNELLGEPVPEGIDEKDDMMVDVRMIDFSNEETYIRMQKEKYEKREQQNLSQYLKDNNVTIEPTESGLYVNILEKGNGRKAEPGKIIVAQYTGTFLNGKKFDSSYDRNEPFEFILGRGEVIRAWDEAFAMMRVGDVASIIAPSSLAYGEQGIQISPGKYMIEPYSTLLFDVQLIDVKDVDPMKVNLKNR